MDAPSQERLRILNLVRDGKITVDEAVRLLRAVAMADAGVPRLDLVFRRTAAPIRAPVTKFGRQPVWLGLPTWPLGCATGEPMRFIGQVAIEPALFPGSRARLASLFMSDFSDNPDPIATWDPEAGENAVILQPGTHAGAWIPRREGPSLERMLGDVPDWRDWRDWRAGRDLGDWGEWPPVLLPVRVPVPCEYAVELVLGADPPVDVVAHADAGHPVLPDELMGNKLGGVPYFTEYPTYPRGGPWRYLLQLHEGYGTPFEVNFGTTGVGHIFLSPDGTRARFLWQR